MVIVVLVLVLAKAINLIFISIIITFVYFRFLLFQFSCDHSSFDRIMLPPGVADDDDDNGDDEAMEVQTIILFVTKHRDGGTIYNLKHQDPASSIILITTKQYQI